MSKDIKNNDERKTTLKSWIDEIMNLPLVAIIIGIGLIVFAICIIFTR